MAIYQSWQAHFPRPRRRTDDASRPANRTYSGVLFLRLKDHSLQPTMAPMINGTTTKAARDSKFITAFDPKNDRAARVETIRATLVVQMKFRPSDENSLA
jgi:hypothetical protein